jgi:hypothetical protein
MAATSVQQFLLYVKALDGQTLSTVSGRRFTVRTYLNYPFFVPESTGKGRSEGKRGLHRFLALYNEIGSLRPTDYARVCRDATYYVAIIAWSRRQRASAEPNSLFSPQEHGDA